MKNNLAFYNIPPDTALIIEKHDGGRVLNDFIETYTDYFNIQSRLSGNYIKQFGKIDGGNGAPSRFIQTFNDKGERIFKIVTFVSTNTYILERIDDIVIARLEYSNLALDMSGSNIRDGLIDGDLTKYSLNIIKDLNTASPTTLTHINIDAIIV